MPSHRRSAHRVGPATLLVLFAVVALLSPGTGSGSAVPGAPAGPALGPHAVTHLVAPPAARPAAVGPATGSVSSENWFNITSSVQGTPEPRDRAAIAYDAADHYVVMFGGYDPAGNGWLGDPWTYQNATWTQLSPRLAPSARSSAMMTYDPALGGVLLFGGFEYPGNYYSDTWLFQAGNWTLLHPGISPAGRMEGSLVYDPAAGAAVLFGGNNGAVTFGDTWEYAAGTWTQVGLGFAPSPRSQFAMAYDNASQGLVLFGGTNLTGVIFDDTWEFLSGSWTELSPTQFPAPQAYLAAATLPSGSVLLTCGQNSTSDLDQSWVFSNGSFTQISPANDPGPRALTAVAYDAVDHYVLLFGGFRLQPLQYHGDTWAFDQLSVSFDRFNTTGIAPFAFHPNVTEVGGVPPIAYAWTFGDLGSGIGPDPTHVYNTGGAYVVDLTIEDGLHLAAVLSTSTTVHLPVTISFSPPLGEAPEAVSFRTATTNGSAPYLSSWNFGDGSNGTGGQPVHVYSGSGTFRVSVVVKDSAGATGTASTNVTVIAAVHATVTASRSSGVAPVAVSFTALVTGGAAPYSYLWDFGDGSTGNDLAAPTHTYIEVGNFTVHVEVRDLYGKTTNATLLVRITGAGGTSTGGGGSTILGLAPLDWALLLVVAVVALSAALLLRRRRSPTADPPPDGPGRP